MDIEKIIKMMSIDEKILLLSGKDFWQTVDYEKYGIKSMFLSDGPSGVRKQAVAADHLGLNESLHATCFPSSGTLSNSWNIDLVKQIGHQLGAEAKSQNVNILLAPGMNIKRNPKCGRNFEYYSEDPYLSGSLATAFIKGVQENNISACVKHFALNNQERQRQVMNTIVDEKTMREIYLTGFEMVVKNAKPLTLMSSYNLINGEYANENTHLLCDILRNEWGYKGMIVTDWGGNNDPVKAIKATSDLEMPSSSGESAKDIKKAYENHEISEEEINASVRRILTVHEATKCSFEKQEKFDFTDSLNAARKGAEESIVLLKNEGNILPIDNKKKVCVIGDFAKTPRYQGAGSSTVNPHKVISMLDAIKENKDINFIGYEQGFKRYGKKSNSLLKKAKNLAKQADIVILAIGLDECLESEGLDRKHINIKENQINLINELATLNIPMVGVIFAGAAIDMSFDDKLDGILFASLLGEQGGNAIIDVLLGKVNPSGKLAETYAKCYEDYPTYKDFPAMNRETIYYEGPWIGYRYFDKNNIKTKYCFGYGLSYTTFEYSNLKINDNSVTFDITNTGDVDGKETAMLFIGLDKSNTIRPIKELKGFKKVFIKAHETVSVEIPFDEFSFRTFDDVANKFVIEEGDYTIYVGRNINDIRLKDIHHVNGETVNKSPLSYLYSGDVKEISDENKKAFKKHVGYVDIKPTGKLVADYNTTVVELKHAKGWTGRAFAGAIIFAHNLLDFFGNHMSANALEMGMYHTPLRNISRMANGMIPWESLDGLIMMFNGHFHKGLHKFFKGKRNFKKARKANKNK